MMAEPNMHLVQILHSQHHTRRVGIVDGATLVCLADFQTTYDLANAALVAGGNLADLAGASRSRETLSYSEIYDGRSDWTLLPPFDHPAEPARCLVSGTGLTHKASAENRSKMHQQEPTSVTDSMRMYQWGLEGGSPPAGQIGAQPEWFYKGNGFVLKAHNQPLTIPWFADDGGEEPEIAGVYLIGPDTTPYRVGVAKGNEFSDHKMERKNYLYLAPSKLRECSLGPELVTNCEFESVPGIVSIERSGETVWSKEIFTGNRNMSHTVANLEHHHFKYPEHRRPGDVHIHFYGADAFSFGEGFVLQKADVMVVAWEGMGRPLRNPLRVESRSERAPIAAKSF